MSEDSESRDNRDSWIFSENKGGYTSVAYYKLMFDGMNAFPIFKKLWKSRCLHKHKVFVWLFLVDRVNTRDMIDRRHWHLDSGLNCVMCNQSQRETREHLFFNCAFAAKIWNRLGISWSLDQGMTIMFQRAKLSFKEPLFFEIATCALWGIWKQRNGKIFEGLQQSYQAWRAIFKKDLSLVSHRVKPKHKEALSEWTDLF
jgi:hypothetical protein